MTTRKQARPCIRAPLKCRQLAPSASPASFFKNSSWKNAFKQQCLERARQKRQQMVHSRRISSPAQSIPQTCISSMRDEHMTSVEDDQSFSYLTFPPKSCSMPSFPSQNFASNSFNIFDPLPATMLHDDPHRLLMTARELVEEELRVNHIGVSPGRPHLVSSAHVTQRSFSQKPYQNIPVPTEQGRMIYECSNNENHILDEDELLELMREVEDELQREEALLEQEINDMETQYIQEKMLLEEQIADFEMWQQQMQQDS